MAKSKGGAVRAELSAQSVYRIDGEVPSVDASGVTIMARIAGRRVTVPTKFAHSSLVAYTGEGAGFVIVSGVQAFDPIAGNVEDMNEDQVVISDVSGQSVYFNLKNAVTPNFVEVSEDDRSLGRSSISTKVLRGVERSSEKPKKSSKKSASAAEGKVSKTKKAGRRR